MRCQHDASLMTLDLKRLLPGITAKSARAPSKFRANDCKAVICAGPLETLLMSSLLSLIFFPLLEFGSERFIVFQMQLSKNIFRFDLA